MFVSLNGALVGTWQSGFAVDGNLWPLLELHAKNVCVKLMSVSVIHVSVSLYMCLCVCLIRVISIAMFSLFPESFTESLLARHCQKTNLLTCLGSSFVCFQ